MVQQILLLCSYPDTIGRYHALRPLTSNLTAEVLPFMLVLQNRNAGEPPALHLRSPIVSQQLHPPSGHDHETQQTGQIAIGPADRQAAALHLSLAPSQALQLTLSNTSMHCYANSSLLGLLWTVAQCQQGVALASLAWRRLLSWLVRRPQRVNLWSISPWLNLMTRWPHPHNRQNDVGEFLQHISTTLLSALARGAWESRQLLAPNSPAQVADQGNMWPLILPAGLAAVQSSVSHPISLQKLLIDWRCQAAVHAATSLPELAILQISRFRPDGSKDHTPVKLSEAVYIPQFSTAGLATTSVRYVITAVIYHLGESLLRGHYRAALVEQGRLCHHTDDNVIPTPHRSSDTAVVEQNSYIYFLRKYTQ